MLQKCQTVDILLDSSCLWAFHFFAMDSIELSLILDCFGDQITIKSTKTYTIWLEMIVKVLNIPIELKGNNYYSKVFKRVNYKLSNRTFWVVITYATLYNYQNTLMHKSEPKANLTLIIHVNQVYELRAGITRTHMIIGSLIIQFWSWFNIPLQRINYTLISYVYYNEIPSAQVCDLLSTVYSLPMNWLSIV